MGRFVKGDIVVVPFPFSDLRHLLIKWMPFIFLINNKLKLLINK
jgi:hypothetical protein